MKCLDKALGRNWAAYHGDCVELIKALPDNSIHYSIFSPPFSSLYTYSNSDRDMGNCRDDNEFYEHFNYLAADLFRVLMPGRNLSFHCTQIPATIERDGWIGLKRFRDKLCDIFEAHGFITYDEKTIWKDPVVEQQRTNALGLLHSQVIKDSVRCRSGLPDYLVTMQKPGKNIEPVSGAFNAYYGTDHPPSSAIYTSANDSYNSFSIETWQRYASPVWWDINPSDTLNGEKGRRRAKGDRDERHIAPLQLGVIRRALQLYSNPDDIVLSPYMGIGSEGCVSLEMNRKFVGFELKPEYFNESKLNLQFYGKDEVEQLDMFHVFDRTSQGAA